MELEITIAVECEGKYLGGTMAYFDPSFGNFLPGDADRIVNFKVFCFRRSRPHEPGLYQRIDITNFLDEKQCRELYDAYLEECRNEKD